MAYEIDFGDGSWEDAAGTIKHVLQDHHRILKGNGSPGMQEVLTTLMATMNTREEERQLQDDQRHKSNTTKLNFILALGAALTILVTVRELLHHF